MKTGSLWPKYAEIFIYILKYAFKTRSKDLDLSTIYFWQVL